MRRGWREVAQCVRLCSNSHVFFSSRGRHTRCLSDWSSDVCSSDLSASLPNYYDYREKIKAFASTAIITENSEPAIVGAAGSPYRVERDRVSPEFFDTLGVKL